MAGFCRIAFSNLSYIHRVPLFLATGAVYCTLSKTASRSTVVRRPKSCLFQRHSRQQTPHRSCSEYCRRHLFSIPKTLPFKFQPIRATSAYLQQQTRAFHVSTRNAGLPFLAAAAAMLKSSSTLVAVQTVGRWLLSLFPIMWAKRHLFSFMSKSIDIQSNPHLAAKQAKYALKSSRLRLYTSALLLIPVSMIGVTLIASSERTPLTGRWRVILLSPAEEEAISSDLQGQKWYDAVRDILSQSSGPGPAPSILPRDDWRWTWVEQTLRRLERAITTLHDVGGYSQVYEHHVANSRQDQTLYPPPPTYPLLPRPRATTLLHEMPLRSDLDHVKSPVDPHGHQTHHVPPHALLGPPYSLLLVNKDESNAFSYGFGPGGAGGVVVYSGFLDDILKSDVPVPPPKAELQSNSIFSGIFSSSRSPSPQPEIPPGPTPEQTSKLATLLAHELSHLILSHHLETLSKGTILFPSIISIMVDTVRSFLYPLTFIVGPFFGDALDRTLRMGFDDLAKAGEACTSMHLEIEADVISARILALAGFDPNAAVSFWQERMECSPNDQGKDTPANSTGFHPVCKERIQSLKEELASWERAKERLLKTLAAGKQAQAIA